MQSFDEIFYEEWRIQVVSKIQYRVHEAQKWANIFALVGTEERDRIPRERDDGPDLRGQFSNFIMRDVDDLQ